MTEVRARRGGDDRSELRVPKGVGVLIAAVLGSSVIGTFLTLAARNLFHGVAVLPSALWILLLTFVAGAGIRESGLRGFCVATLSAFSRSQVLRVSTNCGEQKVLEIGFRLFNRTVIERKILADDLADIRWNTGQASDMAHRDVGDWSVVLWFWHRDHDRETREKQLGLRRPGQAALIIGPARAKRVTEELGSRVLKFLNESGIPSP
ncbi:MAG TPA: hypothetical protein VLC46_08385 [Thermoanaerobaculia bacterium]|jgi:hypothetical protein|nr:hypothetical protein [Thermoanaerobaculia bacterium]